MQDVHLPLAKMLLVTLVPVVAAAGGCQSWCHSNDNFEWDTKCTWQDICGGCPECVLDLVTTRLSSTSNQNQCQSWCSSGKRSWDMKCTWKICGACSECTETVAVSSSTTIFSTEMNHMKATMTEIASVTSRKTTVVTKKNPTEANIALTSIEKSNSSTASFLETTAFEAKATSSSGSLMLKTHSTSSRTENTGISINTMMASKVSADSTFKPATSSTSSTSAALIYTMTTSKNSAANNFQPATSKASLSKNAIALTTSKAMTKSTTIKIIARAKRTVLSTSSSIIGTDAPKSEAITTVVFKSSKNADPNQRRPAATALDGIVNGTTLPKIRAERDENKPIVDEDVLLVSIIIGIAIFLTLLIVLIVLVSMTRITLERKRTRARERERADSSPDTLKQPPSDLTAVSPRRTKIHTFNLKSDSADDEFPRQLTITINDGRLSTISELDTIRVVHTCTGQTVSDSRSSASSPARRSVGSSHTRWSDQNATPQSRRSSRRDLDTLATNATPRGYSTDMSYGNQSYDSCSNIDVYQDNVYINGQTIESAY